MSTCTIPLLNINADECLGDSVGKHNYNFLVLDYVVCNLKYYLSNQNYNNIFTGLGTLVNRFNQINGSQYDVSDDFKNQILLAATTVNLLSSFWGNYEFSIQIPINGVSLTDNDLSILAPTLSSDDPAYVDYLVNTKLKTQALIHLESNYPAISYPDYTIVNVGFFLYNLVPTIAVNGVDSLVNVNYNPQGQSFYNYNTRNVNATYTRDTTHLFSGINLRYYVKENAWNYMGYINQDISTAQPNYNKSTIFEKPVLNTSNITPNREYINNCNPISPNQWYSVDNYIYANGLYTGTSVKLGTVTLTFRTSKNQTSVFQWKASGYNSTTNSGGNDVYLEFDGNTINAYEKFPGSKILVKSWPYPYVNQQGICFKYTYDNNGVAFNACASTSLV